MPRPKTKDDLLTAAKDNYDKLIKLIDGMSEKELNTPFDFSNEPSKKEAHWSRDKNVRDVLIHLYEWHQLMLKFPKNNKDITDKKSAIAFLPFAWTGNAALGDYCVSTTSSHYDWAMKKIKAHIKNCR